MSEIVVSLRGENGAGSPDWYEKEDLRNLWDDEISLDNSDFCEVEEIVIEK